MSKSLLLTTVAIALAGLAVSGCHKQKRSEVVIGGHVLGVADRLTCPERSGRMSRTGMSSDGQSCNYRSDDGEEITLMRLALNGQKPDAVLKPMEVALQGLLPPEAAPSPPGHEWAVQASSHDDDGDDDDDNKDSKDEGDKSARARSHSDDHVDLNLPGLHIKADDGAAQINLPGVHIDAKDKHAHIETSLNGMKNAVINANEKGASVTADSSDAGNTESIWIHSSDQAGPNGYQVVGLLARGPNSGPLVVAQVKSKDKHSYGFRYGFGMEDLKRLTALSLK